MTGDSVVQPRYALTDDGAFLRLRWAAGVTIGADDVRSTMAAVTAASPGGKRPLLVNIGLVDGITLEARHLLIEDTCSLRTGVVGIDEVGKVLTAFNYRSVTPSRYFTDEAEALAWLADGVDVGETTRRQGSDRHQDPFRIRPDDHGVIIVDWDPGTTVTAQVAEALVAAVSALGSGSRPWMVALNHDMIPLTAEALDIFALRLDVAALAIVGTEGDRLIATYYKQLHRPPHPTQYFDTEAQAQDWIARLRR